MAAPTQPQLLAASTHTEHSSTCNSLPYVPVPMDLEWALPLQKSPEIPAPKIALKCRIYLKTF